MRRKEKEMRSRKEMEALLAETENITMAMCSGGEPYLVTMNHGFDPENHCLYLHCAKEGKKIQVLKENPHVWVQALQDLGYLQGECDHRYRSVHIRGDAAIVVEESEKRHALEVMIRQLENDPETVIEKQISEKSVRNVTILRVDILEMWGKSSQQVHDFEETE